MKQKLPCVLLLIIVFASVSVLAQGKADEKAKNKDLLIKATAILEQQPFHEKAKDFRSWAMAYVIQTDDVSVIVCAGDVLAPVMDKKNKYSSELLAQYTLGMAAFKLSNPDKIKDEDSAQLVGLESAIKAYEAMVKLKPKAQFAGMDDFAAKLKSGDLKKIIADAKCGTSKTEPIK